MKKIIFLSLVLLFPSVTFAATNTGYSEDQAQAFFSSVQGCEDVVVGVSAVEPEKIKPKTPLAPTQLFIFGVFNNICDIGSSYSFANVFDVTDAEFDQNGLNNASLNFIKNVNGFDVQVSLNWDGIGKAEKNKNKIHIVNDGIKVHDSDVIANRDANITGTFTINGINYATGTVTGGLSTINAHTVQIIK